MSSAPTATLSGKKDNEQQMVTVDLADGQHSSEIKLSDINMVVEVRSREIIENIYTPAWKMREWRKIPVTVS